MSEILGKSEVKIAEREYLLEIGRNHQTMCMYKYHSEVGIPMLSVNLTQDMATDQFIVDP